MPAPPGDQQVPRPQEVFISYSRKDKEFVRRLDEELKRRDREAWVDWEGIPPGDTWEKTIYGAIESTHTFIFVLTPDSIASEVCGREIAHAAANNKRLVPIVHRDVAAGGVPKSLGELNWIFFRENDDFDEATGKLISALDTDLDWVRAHTRLLTRAIEWDANGRNNSFVLRGDDLRSAERWLAEAGAQKERQPTALQTEYIIASRKASARRQRITIGALIFGLVVASVLAVVAFHQRNIAEEQARIALSRELAAGAAHSSDKELKVLLAREAVSVTYSVDKSVTAEAAEILRTSAPPEPITLSVGHTQPITAVMFSPDGKRIVTASEEAVKIWDTASGDELRGPSSLTISDFGHYGKLIGIAFSGDGKRLAWSSTIDAKVWDSLSAREIFAEPPIAGDIGGFAFSQDGRHIAISRGDELRLWDASSRKQLWLISHNGEWICNGDPVFSPEGNSLAIRNEAAVQLLDASTGKELMTLTNHVDSVYRVVFSPDGKRLGTVGGIGGETVKVWDLASPQKELTTLSNKTDEVTSIAFSPDSNRLAVASDARIRSGGSHSKPVYDYARHPTVILWDIASNTKVLTLPAQTNTILFLTFSPNGAQLATASSDEVCLWDAALGVQLRKLTDGKNFATFNEDGKLLASPSEGAQVKVWDVTSGNELLTLPGQSDLKLLGGAFSPDRQRLATKGSDGKVRVWDVKTGQLLSTAHSGRVDAIAFSPDGKRLGISSLGVPGAVTLFDAVTGGELQTLKGNGRILSIAFNPGGTKVAAGSNEDNARLWDATSGHELRTLNSKSVCGIAFSPDGTRVATVNRSGEGMLRETSSGRSLLSLSDHRRAGFGLLFSPDGTRLATEQQIWDSASGRQLFALGQPGSSGDVGTVRIAFSPDGKLFATGGDKAKLWDASSGKELLTFEDSANVNCVAFSVDGKYLATVCDDWTVRLHPIRIEELMALAHKQVARELSVEEREKYLHTKSGK